MTTEPMGGAEAFRTPVALRRNPVHRFAGRAHEVLDGLAGVPTWAMTARERGETVAELLALRSRIDARVALLVEEADRGDVIAATGATHVAGWLRSIANLTAGEARRIARRAKAVGRHEATAEAWTEGMVSTSQATEIAAAVDALPARVAADSDRAEAHLLACAAEHDAAGLRALGKHLVEVLDPDAADELLARRLAQEERQASRSAYLTTWSDGAGSRHGRFKIPELAACLLDTMLGAIANPARPDPIARTDTTTDPATGTGTGRAVSSPEVRGRAFVELLERYPTDRLPRCGGVSAQVVVTMPLDTLTGGLTAAGVLGTTHQLSPGEARRLAAAAGVIPALLGTTSQVLDLGRRRTFTEPQRLAMALRQGGLCNIHGCDRPATWADANHRTPYAHGGRTTLDNGELICPRHHTRIHQGFTYPRRT